MKIAHSICLIAGLAAAASAAPPPASYNQRLQQLDKPHQAAALRAAIVESGQRCGRVDPPALSRAVQEPVHVVGALHPRRRLCAVRRAGRIRAGPRLRRGGRAEAARLRFAARQACGPATAAPLSGSGAGRPLT